MDDSTKRTDSRRRSPRIVLVGPCASGKSTLAARLQAHGLDAHVCGQEHSAIRNLWQRTAPDVLVALDIDLPTLRSRRSPAWPESLYRTQRERLAPAFAAADMVIDTASNDADAVAHSVLGWLARHRPHAG